MPTTCPSCGAEAVADASHCHRCGAKLDAPSWPSSTDEPVADGGGDWRTAARDAGVGHETPAPPPYDPQRAQGARALPGDSTTWAMGAHLSAFLGAWLALAFVGPLVVWLIKRDEDPFVARHAREALNFNLLALIVLAVSIAAVFLTIGFGALLVVPFLGIAAVFWIIVTIVAAVKAANGQEYSYPFNITLVK